MNGKYPRVCICVGFQLFRPFHLVHVVTVVLLLLYARNYIFRITRCDFLPSLGFLSTRPNAPSYLVFGQRPAFVGLGSDSSHSFAASQLHRFSLLTIFFHRGASFRSISPRSFLKLVLFTIARAFIHSTNQQHDNTITSVSQHLVAHIFIRGVYTLAWVAAPCIHDPICDARSKGRPFLTYARSYLPHLHTAAQSLKNDRRRLSSFHRTGPVDPA
jgi:hypothetical protein